MSSLHSQLVSFSRASFFLNSSGIALSIPCVIRQLFLITFLPSSSPNIVRYFLTCCSFVFLVTTAYPLFFLSTPMSSTLL
ncbi:TPA: hypothetical protein HA265_03965 [Candidatus Woesearchaeota archaeon]|nr:hypothetical protein [Candidatus Woesearchaeota archaeon]